MRILLEQAANGGWTMQQVEDNFNPDIVLGAYSDTNDMVDGLLTHLEAGDATEKTIRRAVQNAQAQSLLKAAGATV